MAQRRLRPGTWTLVNSAGAAQKFQIDYQPFSVQGSSSITFEVTDMGLYDDTSLTEYRVAPSPQTIVSNVGGEQILLVKGRKDGKKAKI